MVSRWRCSQSTPAASPIFASARRQRRLGGLSPDRAVRERLRAKPTLASKLYQPPFDSCVLPKALLIIEAAKEVSQPDN